MLVDYRSVSPYFTQLKPHPVPSQIRPGAPSWRKFDHHILHCMPCSVTPRRVNPPSWLRFSHPKISPDRRCVEEKDPTPKKKLEQIVLYVIYIRQCSNKKNKNI